MRNKYLWERNQAKVLVLRPGSPIFHPPTRLLITESKCKNQNTGRNVINLFWDLGLEKQKQKGVPLLAKAVASFVSSFHVVAGCT